MISNVVYASYQPAFFINEQTTLFATI